MDKLFFRRLLEVPGSTPYESFFLELGVLPVTAIVKARRINYLYSILQREAGSMLNSFFITQWNNPTRGDWTEEVKSDLEDFWIPCSFEWIKSKSRLSFKSLVKTKAEEYALSILKDQQTPTQKWKTLDTVHSRCKVISPGMISNHLRRKQFSSIAQGWKGSVKTSVDRMGQSAVHCAIHI